MSAGAVRERPARPLPNTPAPASRAGDGVLSVAVPAVRDAIPTGPKFPLLQNGEFLDALVLKPAGRADALPEDPDLFAVPPPLPDPSVGRRERRKVRRQAQYWEDRRKANLCVACGKRPPAAAHLSRCTACLEIQIRSASRRKRNSQSTAHPSRTHLNFQAVRVTVNL